MRFTEKGVKALRAKAERYEVFEDNSQGFGVRVTPHGTKTWISRYRDPRSGKLVKVTIATCTDKTLADARIEHGEIRKLLRKGKDPRQLRREAKQAEQTAGTVGELAKEYLDRYAKKHKKSWKEDERILNKDILPEWRDRKAKDITRRDIIRLLDGIMDRGAPVSANNALARISRLFWFAVDRGILEASPCVGIRAPGPKGTRDRVLSEDEVRTFWHVLSRTEDTQDAPAPNMTTPLRLALKLQLVTAQRRGEIAIAERTEFDLECGWWTIPAEHAKNGNTHRVPLTETAVALVNELFELGGDSVYLLPTPKRKEDQPITPRALSRAIRNNRALFPGAPFGPHDLRRTAATFMAAAGVPRLVVGKVLNHTEQDITAVYDRHAYEKEKREALDAWETKLLGILNARGTGKRHAA